MKKLAQKILAILTRLTLRRFNPRIVGITGSIGKTSAKEAISQVLACKFKVRASSGNYNNEIGLPFSVLGAKNPGKNPLAWLGLVIFSLIKLFYKKFPDVLVLEMGADRPGDIAYLTNLVSSLDAAVITDIGVSHMEFYPSEQSLIKEKILITKVLKPEGIAVLNFDSLKVFENKNSVAARIVGFGFKEESQILASDFHLITDAGTEGENFKVHYKGTVVPFFLRNTIGLPPVYAALAAAAVGLDFGMNMVEISEALKNYKAPAGRLKVFRGIKKTLIIDDTYNAAPDSTVAALDALKSFATNRKILALGSMAELGKTEDAGIKKVAQKIVETDCCLIFLTGSQADHLSKELSARKFGGKIIKFESSSQALGKIQNYLMESDTILVKGSQSSRMEKIVKDLLENKPDGKFLVRQTKEWSGKP